jgi:hypothetical protein
MFQKFVESAKKLAADFKFDQHDLPQSNNKVFPTKKI